MAEYCSHCSPFKRQGNFDIDLFKIALKLNRGNSTSFICEGCNIRGIYKDEQGLIYLVEEDKGELKFSLTNIETL